jgi:hypothetical protein
MDNMVSTPILCPVIFAQCHDIIFAFFIISMETHFNQGTVLQLSNRQALQKNISII